jgi:CubicO group peptidase (beta-lactamase class C family)
MLKHFLIDLAILFLIFPSLVYGQDQNIVKPADIISELHHSNIGNIVFTDSAVPVTSIRKSDFLASYTLTNKSNLFFIAFLGNSMTNYLHMLAPDLTADALVQAGNYQFTIYIDQNMVYQSNLIPGAPFPLIQDTATIISKPFIDNQHEGAWWSQSFWNRFMHHGGDSALSEGPHYLKLEIRPYIQLNELLVGPLMASGELNILVARKVRLDLKNIHLSPIKPYPGLKPSAEQFDSSKIKNLVGNINENVFKHINSLVVLKHGKVLIEEYFNGETRNTLHDPRSVGKSFASTMTGIAIREGYLKSEYQGLKDFYTMPSYSNYDPIKENITIKELLTMSSAFDGDDGDDHSPGNEENMYPMEDWVKFTLDLPLKPASPEGAWHYFTAGVIVLGDILNKQVKGGLERYADEKLFKPLGISNYQWQYTPQHVPNTAGGIQMHALDFAKYGQLYKNNGTWNGKQIVPVTWVNQSLSHHKSIPDRKNEYYGYLFWSKYFKVKGKPHEAYYCAGNGGNHIIIFKDLPLVIVVTASAYGQSYAHQQVDSIVSEYILPAVIP